MGPFITFDRCPSISLFFLFYPFYQPSSLLYFFYYTLRSFPLENKTSASSFADEKFFVSSSNTKSAPSFSQSSTIIHETPFVRRYRLDVIRFARCNFISDCLAFSNSLVPM